jgi:hypothetical protein
VSAVTGLGRPGRSWPPRAPPRAGGNPAQTRPGQRAGSAGQTPGSSLTRGGPDARPAHRTRVVGRDRKRHRAVQEGESPGGRVSGSGQLDQLRVGSGTWPCFTVEKEAQQEPARHNATSESEHSVRLGSLTGPSARAPAEAGPGEGGPARASKAQRNF